MHPDTYSSELAKFIYELDYNSLEEEVIKKAKLCLLDFIGVSLIGSNTDLARITIKTMKSMGGIKESTIIGNDSKLPSMNAAFVNGVMAHVHELDDGHRFAMGHPGIPVISAALAAGEKNESSGKDLIAAIVAGYEVFVRIGSSSRYIKTCKSTCSSTMILNWSNFYAVKREEIIHKFLEEFYFCIYTISAVI